MYKQNVFIMCPKKSHFSIYSLITLMFRFLSHERIWKHHSASWKGLSEALMDDGQSSSIFTPPLLRVNLTSCVSSKDIKHIKQVGQKQTLQAFLRLTAKSVLPHLLPLWWWGIFSDRSVFFFSGAEHLVHIDQSWEAGGGNRVNAHQVFLLGIKT